MEEAAAVVSKVVPAVAEVQQVAKRAASNKSKSWRSGKNRERLPRFAAAQKGVRLLASYRAANPQRDLPLLCRQMKVLSYDPARYGLAAAVAEGLLGFPESGNLLECMLKLEGYWLSDDEKQRQPPGKVHSRVRACTKLCDAYERLIKEVIGPDLLADFNTGHSNGMERTEDPETVLLYQFPPTLRIFCSARERDDISAGSEAARRGMTLAQDNGAVCVDIRCQDGATAVCDLKIGDTCGGSPEAQYKRLGRLHNDAQYGHQPGEVNFWLPLTRLARSNTLWAETAEERGDFQPILVEEMAFLACNQPLVPRTDSGGDNSDVDQSREIKRNPLMLSSSFPTCACRR